MLTCWYPTTGDMSDRCCPLVTLRRGTRGARNCQRPRFRPRWEKAATLRLTDAGGPLIGSRDVGVGALGGVRGWPGAAHCDQDCGRMSCPTGGRKVVVQDRVGLGWLSLSPVRAGQGFAAPVFSMGCSRRGPVDFTFSRCRDVGLASGRGGGGMLVLWQGRGGCL
jgi:hypothetical protein